MRINIGKRVNKGNSEKSDNFILGKEVDIFGL